ncbi:MAG: endolytic transglycosylase MltG, partial [Persicimonas sp.]
HYADLAEALARGGRAEHHEITLAEGATIFHMADYLDEEGIVERDGFLEAARDPRALALAGLEAESFEGYLFPDTYQVREDVGADEIIELAHARWQAVWLSIQAQHEESLEELVDEHGLDRHELVTLASLVERETASDEERPIVARVFLNRLEEGMPLQSDPTCVYGEDTYDKAPTPDLCKDSLNRYSTYVEDGLPPGPVANPSRASLAAVADPSDDPDAMEYLYFVARRDGTQRHHFSKNFEEHKRAIQRYLR